MAVFDLPGNIPFGVGSGMGQARFDLQGTSESTGTSQTRPMSPPRWTLQLVQPPAMTPVVAGRWKALTLALRGRINHVAAWDVGNPAPLGTMRGTPTLSGGVSAGATTLVLATGQPGCTLLQGDKVQLGTGLGTSQLVMVLLDAVANGSGLLTVTTEPPLRLGFAGGTAVAWSRPRAYFKAAGERANWSYGPSSVTTGMAIDLLEHWQ